MTSENLYADAMWQRFFTPVLLKGGNELFLQTVGKSGGDNNIRLHLIKNSQYSSYVVKSAYGGDDHNVGMSVVLPSGRVMTTCCTHGEATGIRYKVTNQTSYPYTLSAERTIPKLIGYTYQSYSQVYYLSDGTVRVFSRAYNTGTLVYGYAMFTTTAASIDAGTEVWTQTNIYTRVVATVPMRPYPCIRQNPSNMARLDFFVEGANIAEGTTDIGHFYLDVTAGDKWCKSDGTQILAALPFDLYSEWTLAAAVVSSEDWSHQDAGYDAGGNPRALLAYFPTGGGGAKTDVQYKMSYWNGSTWRQFRVGTLDNTVIDGSGTVGAGTLDTIDKNRMWLSEYVGGIYQVREYSINQAGETSTYVGTVSEQNTKHDYRPYATGLASLPVAFIRVNYVNSYTDFDSSLVISGGQVLPKLVADWRITETSGQTLADSSGNGLDIQNGLTSGATSTDLTFVTNGVSAAATQGSVMVTGAPADLIGTNFYFAVVANTSGITGTGTHQWLARDDGTARQFQFRILNGSMQFLWRQVSLAAVTLTAGAVVTGSSTFRLYSAWMKDGVVKCYVNGVQLGSDGAVATPFDGNTATTGICLAARLNTGAFAEQYPGVIAAARVYRDVYDAADIATINAQLMAQIRSDKGIGNLTGYVIRPLMSPSLGVPI